jgi:thiol:disulfide interchange protein
VRDGSHAVGARVRYWLSRDHLSAFWRANRLEIVVVLALLAAYLGLHSTQSPVGTAAELAARLRQGQPTALYFYSNRCSICLISGPAVDALERELGTGRLLRLNVASAQGGEIAPRYGVRGVPTVLVFDGRGELAAALPGRVQQADVLAAIEAAEAGARAPATSAAPNP